MQSCSEPWSRKNSSFLSHLFCSTASFVNIFFSFYVFRLFYGSLVSFIYTFKTRSIILRVTHSTLLSNFLFLFLFPQEFHLLSFRSKLLSSFSPSMRPLFGAVCPVCHIIVSYSPDCCSFSVHFVPRFFPLTFYSLFFFGNKIKLPAISQRWRSIPLWPSVFFLKGMYLSQKQIILKSFSDSRYSGNLFSFCSSPSDILTAIKEIKHHYR